MSLFKKSNSKISSRRQIAIQGVDEDGTLKLPSEQYRAVLEVSSINLLLKSEAEQDAIIETYQTVLNSLACPIQIIIQIRELDVDKYLDDYQERLNAETEEIYKQQIIAYTNFVRDLIKSNKILTRHFYVVVPFANANKSSTQLVKDQLALNISIVEQGLAKLGMHSRRLSGTEVLELFSTFYNAESAKTQPITERVMHMLSKEYV